MNEKKINLDITIFTLFLINIILIIIALLGSQDIIKEYALFAEKARFFQKETVYFITAMTFFVPSILGTFVSLANIRFKKQALRVINYLISILIIIVIIGVNESFNFIMNGISYFLLIAQTIIMILLNMYNCMFKFKKVKYEKKRRNIIF